MAESSFDRSYVAAPPSVRELKFLWTGCFVTVKFLPQVVNNLGYLTPVRSTEHTGVCIVRYTGSSERFP